MFSSYIKSFIFSFGIVITVFDTIDHFVKVLFCNSETCDFLLETLKWAKNWVEKLRSFFNT